MVCRMLSLEKEEYNIVCSLALVELQNLEPSCQSWKVPSTKSSLLIIQAEIPESGEIRNCDVLPSADGITGAGSWLSCPQDHNVLWTPPDYAS